MRQLWHNHEMHAIHGNTTGYARVAAGEVDDVRPVDLWVDFGFLVFEFEGWEIETIGEFVRRAWRAGCEGLVVFFRIK